MEKRSSPKISSMPTVSDTSPISNLAWIGRLNLVREQFHEIWIPQAVVRELQNIRDETVRKSVMALVSKDG
jgi:predicted nucleic acid-binding protein